MNNANMSAITTVVLAAFGVYGVAWYTGTIEGNFSLLLFLAVVVTGAYWLAEKFYFWPQRKAAAEKLVAEQQQREAELAKAGVKADAVDIEQARQKLLTQPWWLDWTAGLFPVIFIVFLLRSFFFEPFKIPSGSMLPTLHVGDLILVNKFHYGVRLPVIHTQIIPNNQPQRGDVIVFRYPPQPSLDYIKRVVAVAGDEVAYLNRELIINGQPVPRVALDDFYDRSSMRYAQQFQETIDGREFNTLIDRDRPSFLPSTVSFAYHEQCRYSVEGVVCRVPDGHFFVLGDNRDNSLDSRFWGFVPEANIVGKAFFVWMNFGDLRRIGSFQ